VNEQLGAGAKVADSSGSLGQIVVRWADCAFACASLQLSSVQVARQRTASELARQQVTGDCVTGLSEH